MGDGLKLSKDKRHRSSSSIAGGGLDATRSERKLDIRALIPEMEDHFATAEARCDNLQEKIDLVKVLKRKKKLNKRSMTRVNEATVATDNVPFITVRTQPKKKVSPQATRLRRIEVPPNPVRGYVDPATVEQHRMLGQVWGYGHNYNHQNEFPQEQKSYARTRPRRNRADGDGMCGSSVDPVPAHEVACGEDDDFSATSDLGLFERPPGKLKYAVNVNARTHPARKGAVMKVITSDDGKSSTDEQAPRGAPGKPGLAARSTRRKPRQPPQKTSLHKLQQQQDTCQKAKVEERPVVELFNKSRQIYSPPPYAQPPPRPITKKEDRKPGKLEKVGDQSETVQHSDISGGSVRKPTVRRKVRSRNYELPTVASQLKQADMRYHCSVSNRSNIPFIVSKSTAPSHNIGINIQQVLNGVKMQQPLNGIPLTIAHHMGLGHVPTYSAKKPHKQVKPSLNKSAINAITVGKRMLLLPSHRSISYNRLLSLYRDGDGMVPRFLRSISRPNYIYTSMYDLQWSREEPDGTTSQRGPQRQRQRVGAAIDDDTKRSLAEYAQLYDEYNRLENMRKLPGQDSPEMERKCEELLRELLTREELIKKMEQENTNAIAHSTSNVRSTAQSAATIADVRRKREQS